MQIKQDNRLNRALHIVRSPQSKFLVDPLSQLTDLFLLSGPQLTVGPDDDDLEAVLEERDLRGEEAAVRGRFPAPPEMMPGTC